MTRADRPFTLAVLISGNGSNLQAIIDAIAIKQCSAEIKLVISDQPDAYGLQRAAQNHIPTRVLSGKDYANKLAYDTALMQCIAEAAVDLIVLAGFMRILTPAFVAHFPGKIINIHPSLLPKYRGLNTYQKALNSGDSMHGTTVHIVTSDLDAGPIIAQAATPITADDSEATLKARVQQLEHELYPTVIHWFAEQRLLYKQGTVYFDGSPLSKAINWSGTAPIRGRA